MIYKDIVTRRTYQKNGEEKSVWFNVGTYKKTDDGKEFMELNMFPNTTFYVFEKKENNGITAAPQTNNVMNEPKEVTPKFEDLTPRPSVDPITGQEYLLENIPF